MNDADYNYLKFFFTQHNQTLDTNEQKILLDIYNRTFNTQKWPTSCSPCWVGYLDELKVAYQQHKIIK